MDDFTWKLISVFLILFLGVLGVLVPIILMRCTTGPRATSILRVGTMFASGVFLSAGLIHLLPDADEDLEMVGLPDYPFAYLFATSAFLLLLILNRTMLYCGHRRAAQLRKENSTTNLHESDMFTLQVSPVPADETEEVIASVARSGSPLSAMALMFALCIHSIIAGLTLGASTDFSGFVVILVAIVAHKATAAFALSVLLIRLRVSHKITALMLTIFVLSTPVGILIAWLSNWSNVPAASGSLQAIAAGTFIFIATVELLGTEFHTIAKEGYSGSHEVSVMASFAFGVTVMSVVAIWV